MGAAEKIEDTVTAEEVAPMFGCKARHIVDRVSKRPGFPQPVNRRPLTWTRDKVLEYRAFIQDEPQARRR